MLQMTDLKNAFGDDVCPAMTFSYLDSLCHELNLKSISTNDLLASIDRKLDECNHQSIELIQRSNGKNSTCLSFKSIFGSFL